MDSQTYLILQALGSAEGLDLALELLEAPGTVEDLVERVGEKRAGFASGTASRRLDAMVAAGLIYRPTPRGEYEVLFPEEVDAIFLSATQLAAKVLAERQASEEALRKRVARGRLRRASRRDDASAA